MNLTLMDYHFQEIKKVKYTKELLVAKVKILEKEAKLIDVLQ